jgi:hypothetical protein
MNIVWIEDEVEFKKDRYVISISVRNYTQKKRKFKLFAEHPEAKVENIKPKAAKTAPGLITWNLTNLKPVENLELSFELTGLEKGALDEAELFIDGIDPINVVGAEQYNNI